jgi:restriction system protein
MAHHSLAVTKVQKGGRMAIWLVRAGEHGEREEEAIQKGLAIIGWEDLPDLSKVTSREDLAELMKDSYPDEKPKRLINWTGQVWAFRDRIQPNDLVVLPLKTRAAIAIGQVTGPYQYRVEGEDQYHARPVKWIKTDFPRSPSLFGQDLLYSLGAFMTVCQIRRNDAEKRIRAIVEGKTPATFSGSTISENADEDATFPADIELYAQDRIREHIEQKFKGHGLARLVDAVLRATGYTTVVSPPGPDGGVDIVAGRGAMGFDQPRLCVQVKSGNGPVKVEALQRLHGSMKKVSADQGLFVSWDGFNNKVPAEEREQFFTIRLWDSGKLIKAILDNYEALSAEIQAELPLKRVWVLVQDTPEGE